MKAIDLSGPATEKPATSFWRRQFQKEPTKNQKSFDWIFGIILPVICFSMDPAIFKTSELWGSDAYLAVLKPFAYLLSFVSIMALMAALIWGAKLKWVNGFLAGLFFVGSIISFGIGVMLLPISLLGLIIVIGALGFTPLLTSAVYLRNAFRSYQTAKPIFENGALIRTIVLTGLFSIVTPAVINLEINHMRNKLELGESQTILTNSKYLYFVAPIVNVDFLRRQFNQEPDPKRREAIAQAYKEITGAKINTANRSAFD